MDDFLEISCVWERPFSIQKIILPIFGPCEKLQEMGEGIDRSQSVFYFVPQESHSQACSTLRPAESHGPGLSLRAAPVSLKTTETVTALSSKLPGLQEMQIKG